MAASVLKQKADDMAKLLYSRHLQGRTLRKDTLLAVLSQAFMEGYRER